MDNSHHLFDLPEEMLVKITSYLDFKDLKYLTQTCKYMNEISGLTLAQMSKIDLWKILSYSDIKTLSATKRKYHTVKLSSYKESTNHDLCLSQVSVIPSIKLDNIILEFCSISLENLRFLQKYDQQIKTITIDIEAENIKNIKLHIHQIKVLFPKAKIIFKPHFSPILYFGDESLLFHEANAALMHPPQMVIQNYFQNLTIQNNIHTVRKLKIGCDTQNTLSKFKELTVLEIEGAVDLKLLETVIENNKTTLIKLKISRLEEPWHFKVPFQMKELTCCFIKEAHSTSYANILENQRHLRSMLLNHTVITNELLTVLSKNKLLTAIEFNNCTFEESLEYRNFEFLKNIFEITLHEFLPRGLALVNSIFDNAEKANRVRFEIEMMDEDTDDIFISKTTVLKDLKVLLVCGMDFSKYVSKRIKAPNLEVCEIDCFPDFLFECKRLRTLNIGIETDYDQVVNILNALQCLETFAFQLEFEDFDRTVLHVLKNIGRIKHFRFDVISQHGDNTFNENLTKITESALKTLDVNWRKFGSQYQTDNFSFEIYIF